MARTSRRSSGNGRGARPAAEGGEKERIIDAALALIPSEGWRRLSLPAIAAEARLPLVSVYRAYGSKAAILAGFSRRIDEKALAGAVAAESEERPRDRLFDLLMRRFDALRPYRPALEVLRRELPGDPASAVCVAAGLLRSMRWMLEAAGIATAGLGGALAVKLSAAAYLSAMRVFARDDTSDLGRTMASLDRALGRIELVLRPLSRPRGAAASTAA